MSKKGVRLISVFSFLVFCFLFVRPVCADDLKFAYVDIGKVFDEYEKTKKFDQELQDEGKNKQEKRDAIVYEVRRLKDEQALLSDEKKKDTQAAIDNKLKELDDFDQSAQKELTDKRNVIMKEIFADIDGLMKQYGERKGYDLIFNERALLHKSSKLDQTNEVLKELNANYQKQKK